MKRISLGLVILCLLFLAGSLWYWLAQPNNFLYTKEINGVWDATPGDYKASGYHVKLKSDCAAPVYREIESIKGASSYDLNRFLKNRREDVEFTPVEISFPSRFKSLTDNYTTYDEPTLKRGLSMSFRVKCLYDKDCTLSDSIDYLFIKIGIKYFLQPAQANYLKQNCISSKKMYYRVKTSLNFGRSTRHYRNGILQWLTSGSTLWGVATAAIFLIVYFKKSSNA